MKPLILALLLLSPSGVALAQSDDPSKELSELVFPSSKLIRLYDRFEDRTRYWTSPAILTPGLDLTATFSFKGKGKGHHIEGFRLIFSSVSSDWQYLKNSRLRCLIDGDSVDLGSAAASDGDVKTGYRSVEVKEILAFSVKYQLLQRIVKAKRVEMRLGSTEFETTEFFRQSLKELLNKVQVETIKE